MRSADWQMRKRGGHDDGCSRQIRGKAVDRLDLEYLRAHRLNNLPAPDRGAESHRGGSRELDPGLNLHLLLQAGGDQGERNNPHRLLGIVRAVRERLEGRRNDLAGAEPFIHGMRTAPAEYPFQYRHDDVTDDECDNRRDNKSDNNAVEAAQIELVGPGSREDRSGQRADERVRGRRRNPEPPGDQVPNNRRDKRGRHNLKPVVELRRIGDASPDCLRDPGEGQRAGEIHHRSHKNGHAWGQSPRRDRRGDGVRRVVEPIDEVERQGQEDHDPDDPKINIHSHLFTIAQSRQPDASAQSPTSFVPWLTYATTVIRNSA